MTRPLIHDLVELSHAFGGERYVRGGGGNASAKDRDTLWIKQSGTPMADVQVNQLVAVDRRKLKAYFDYPADADWHVREHALKNILADAVADGGKGRPSIETALHDGLPHTFALHIHPPLVNALTCAADGERIAAELFPDALWVPTAAPGYGLCMAVRARLADYHHRRMRESGVILMRHQGVFAIGDTVDDVGDRARGVVDRVERALADAGIPEKLIVGPDPDPDTIGAVFDVLGDVAGLDASSIIPGGAFAIAEGAISPDHIVYCRAHAFRGEVTPEALRAFHARYGYWPRVVATDTGVYGVGRTHKAATVALAYAHDAALVAQYAAAFGGVTYLPDDLAAYVEQWDTECYRRAGAGA